MLSFFMSHLVLKEWNGVLSRLGGEIMDIDCQGNRFDGTSIDLVHFIAPFTKIIIEIFQKRTPRL